MRAKASAITASRPLRYWRFSSLVNLVGLVGVHRHVMQALRNLRLDIVIITVCSPTRKRRTKTSALSFMAVSIMCFLRPYSVLMEHRDEPPVCWSAVVSSASQNRLARLGMVAPSLGTSTVPGLLFSPSVQPSAPSPGRHLVNAPGLSLAHVCCNFTQPGRVEVPLYQYREKTHEDDCLHASTGSRSCVCGVSLCWRRNHGQNEGRLR